MKDDDEKGLLTGGDSFLDDLEWIFMISTRSTRNQTSTSKEYKLVEGARVLRVRVCLALKRLASLAPRVSHYKVLSKIWTFFEQICL